MIINVSQYHNFIKALLDNEPMLAKVSVCGEVSNLRYTNESIFFSLKDAFCQMDCFSYISNLSFNFDQLKNGTEVIVDGNVSYLKSGKVSFFVNKITFTQKDGEQHLKYLELKKKLMQLGFFDKTTKNQLKKYVFNIGVVTSKNGAVIHDLADVIYRRNKYAKIYLYDVNVQGEGASQQIANGIRYFNDTDVDCIIIARGGGSKEDLSAFDTEEVALAIKDSNKTTISAVGHETDVSICDFCADIRAGTPSIAGELVTANNVEEDFRCSFKNLFNNFTNKINQINTSYNRCFNNFNNSLQIKINKAKSLLSFETEKCFYYLNNSFLNQKTKYAFALKKLELLSPKKSLKDGKAIVYKQGKKVFEPKQLKVGDIITLKMLGADVKSKVQEVKYEV